MTKGETSFKAATGVIPLLVQGAVRRTGDTNIPGQYCAKQHVWTVDGEPIVHSSSSLSELSTKTEAQLERDDMSPRLILEMQTKTKAELERDDQVNPLLALERMVAAAV